MEVRVIWHPAWHPECLLALQQLHGTVQSYNPTTLPTIYCACHPLLWHPVYNMIYNIQSCTFQPYLQYIVHGTQSGFLPWSRKTFLLAVNCKWSAATPRSSLFHIAWLFLVKDPVMIGISSIAVCWTSFEIFWAK